MEFRTADDACRSLRPRKNKEETFGDNPSDEEDFVEDQETDIEQECDEDESASEYEEESEAEEEAESEQEVTPTGRKRLFVYGKNQHKWCLRGPETRSDEGQSNIIVRISGPKNDAVKVSSPLETWSLLFTDEMIDMIVQHTNEEIERRQVVSTIEHIICTTTTATEIKAFIGLLYFAGLKKSAHVSIEELWSTEFGHTLLKAVMCSRRYKFLAARLRFDDKDTQAERQKHDLLAPIRDLWEKFIQNCTKNYTPSEEMTVGEQIFSFRGKFAAKVYKKRPARYGINIVCLNDAITNYLYNAVPYVEKKNTLSDGIPSYYVRTVCQPISKSNRNVTCDNFNSSIEIFDNMLEEYSLTMVGIVRKKDPHIPESFKRTASVGTVRYAYDTTKTLISYCPKRREVVLLLSTLHKNRKCPQMSGKPEIVEYYDRTKRGTYCFNQLCNLHSCSRATLRWTMRFFMGMLDQAGVNSGILYNFIPTNKYKDQREFMKELVLALVLPQLEERSQLLGLHKEIRDNIFKIIGKGGNAVGKTDKLQKRKRCSICPTKVDRKVAWCCYRCGKAVCEEHRRMICVDCIE